MDYLTKTTLTIIISTIIFFKKQERKEKNYYSIVEIIIPAAKLFVIQYLSKTNKKARTPNFGAKNYVTQNITIQIFSFFLSYSEVASYIFTKKKGNSKGEKTRKNRKELFLVTSPTFS